MQKSVLHALPVLIKCNIPLTYILILYSLLLGLASARFPVKIRCAFVFRIHDARSAHNNLLYQFPNRTT
jgi:hypothetical protein